MRARSVVRNDRLPANASSRFSNMPVMTSIMVSCRRNSRRRDVSYNLIKE